MHRTPKKSFDWREVLRWWFVRDTIQQQPNPKQISEWYDYVSSNFVYKATWGIGSLINLFMQTEEEDEPIRPLELEDWPRTGLPWIAFWLKELLTWGTLDPVAAFLLARTSNFVDRATAEEYAKNYYKSHYMDFESLNGGLDDNSLLDPINIRDWALAINEQDEQKAHISQEQYPVNLAKSSNKYVKNSFTVYPIVQKNEILWIDVAGYELARTISPGEHNTDSYKYEHILNVEEGTVTVSPYLKHDKI